MITAIYVHHSKFWESGKQYLFLDEINRWRYALGGIKSYLAKPGAVGKHFGAFVSIYQLRRALTRRHVLPDAESFQVFFGVVSREIFMLHCDSLCFVQEPASSYTPTWMSQEVRINGERISGGRTPQFIPHL